MRTLLESLGLRSLTATQRTFQKVGVSRLCQECPAGSARPSRRLALTRSPADIAEKSSFFHVAIAWVRRLSAEPERPGPTFFGGVLRVAVKLATLELVPPATSFPNAEPAEDPVEDVVGVNRPGNLPQLVEGLAGFNRQK